MFLDLCSRGYLALSLLVLLAVICAGCGSGQPQSPLEVLQRSYERGKDIKSFRAQMDMEITVPDENMVMTVDIETGRDGRVRTVIDIDTLGDNQPIEMIIAEPYVFVEVPDKGWTQISAQAIAESTGQSVDAVTAPTAFYSSLFPTQEVPWELYVVESLGPQEMDGVETEHLSVEFDFREVWQHLGEEQRERFLQASPDPGVAREQLIEALEVRGVEVWIDDQGYSRRAVMEIRFSGEGLASLGGGPMSMKMDMRISDINKEITIALPEGYEDFEPATGSRAAPAPTSAYQELLALIPDTPETRSLVYLSDYEVLRKAASVALPGPNANQEALKNYLRLLATTIFELGATGWGEAPYISGYTRHALATLRPGQYTPGMTPFLAFDLRDVKQSGLAGAPTGMLGVMLGDFDPSATERELKNCAALVPNCDHPLSQTHEGVAFYSWGRDLEVDLTRRFGPPAFDQLGRGGRIAVQDRHVFYTVETPGMQALIEASLGQRHSLLDVEEFLLLAKAMSELGSHASILSDQTLSMEESIQRLHIPEEDVERIRAQMATTPALKPYIAFATGEGIDQDGPFMALALVHGKPQRAEENATLFLRRINEASSLVYGQRWDEMVDKAAVRAEGRLLVAKLHGRIARAWASLVYDRDTLIAHGGPAPASDDKAPPTRVHTSTPRQTATEAPVQQVIAPTATLPAPTQASVQPTVPAVAPTATPMSLAMDTPTPAATIVPLRISPTQTSATIPTATATPTPAPLGLVAWWPGDGNANNTTGGNPGTLEGGTTFANGITGQAFSFDGDGDFVVMPARPLTALIADQFTIQFWANPGPGPDRPTFGFTGSGALNTNNPIASYDSFLSLASGSGDFQLLNSLPVAAANAWTHYAIVDDGTNYRVYVNGLQTQVTAITATPASTTNRAFVIGQSGFSSGYQDHFNGLIDEFGTFNRALSAAEIQAIFEAGSAGE